MQNNIGEARRSYAQTLESGKFTQEDAARYFGVSKGTYSAWEQGVGKGLKGEQLCRLADLYNVSVDYLLMRTDIPDPYDYPTRNSYSKNEQLLIEAYRKCDRDGKEAIEASTLAIAARFDKKDTAVLEEQTA